MARRRASWSIQQVLFRRCVSHAKIVKPWRSLTRILEALQAKVGTLSLEAQTKLEKDTAKKEAKAEAKADAALKKKLASQVRISAKFVFDRLQIVSHDISMVL